MDGEKITHLESRFMGRKILRLPYYRGLSLVFYDISGTEVSDVLDLCVIAVNVSWEICLLISEDVWSSFFFFFLSYSL